MVDTPTGEPASGIAGSTSEDEPWSRTQRLVLAVTCAVLFLDGLDLSMIQVALPSVQRSLSLSNSSAQWVVSGFVLGYGGLLLLGGRAADLFGRKRVLVAAMMVFIVASLLGTVVSDGDLLIAARFVKGASAAFTAPASLSILSTTFRQGHHRNKALGIYTTVGGSGVVFGSVAGGLLTEASWRWTFGLIVPVGILVLLAALLVVPADSTGSRDQRGRIDIVGALAATAGSLLFVRTIVRAPNIGWSDSETVVSFVVVGGLVVAFLVAERYVAHPLVRLSLLRDGSLVRASIGAVALMGGSTAYNIISTLYYQDVLGWGPLKTGLVFVVAPVFMASLAQRVGPWAVHVGTPPLIALGSLLLIVSWALLLGAGTDTNWPIIVASLALQGSGFALSYPPLNIQALEGVPDEEQGVASGLVSSAFQIGSAFVLSIATAVLIANTNGVTKGQRIHGYHAGLYVAIAAAGVGLVTALVGIAFGRNRALQPAFPDEASLDVAAYLPGLVPDQVNDRKATDAPS